MDTSKTFRLSVSGELTKKPYGGEFTVKTMPTFQDEMDFDAFYADIIGPRPENYKPPVMHHNYAFMLAFIRSRTIKAPDWWVNSNFGLGIEKGDLNVITSLFTLTKDAEAKAEEEVEAEAAAAKKDLKKSQPKE